MQKILTKINDIIQKIPQAHINKEVFLKNEWEIIDSMLDITSLTIDTQKEAFENQLIQSETVIESIPTATIIVDLFLNCKHYNQTFAQNFIKKKDITVSQTEKFWKVFEELDIQDHFKNVLEIKKTKVLPGYFFKDLNEYFDITITPLRNRDKNIIGILGIFHNVTKAKLTEKMRVDFVANVSHEIRTPLTSIKGYSQLLKAQEASFPEELIPILDKINNNTERLKDLFDNLLHLSVIESHHEVEKNEINLEELILRIKANLEVKYLDRNVETELSFKQETIRGDEKLLEQVFTNLLDNAIKYGKLANTTIKISSHLEENFVYIYFTDNGPGIPPTELPRIFERFYRAQSGVSKKVEGTGLGLSIVKHIIHKHHGDISVESHADKGTTFIIKLPN